jgi:hypothetical protein
LVPFHIAPRAPKTVKSILALSRTPAAQVRPSCRVLEGVISQQLLPRSDGNGLILACVVMLVNAQSASDREGKPHQINTSCNQHSSGVAGHGDSLVDSTSASDLYDDYAQQRDAVQAFSSFASERGESKCGIRFKARARGKGLVRVWGRLRDAWNTCQRQRLFRLKSAKRRGHHDRILFERVDNAT